MRKLLLLAAAAGLVLLIGLAGLNMVISAYSNCVYINFNRPDRNLVLFGRVETVRDQDGWIITRLRLCGSAPAGATVKVLTPADAWLVDIGEAGEYQGQPVFHWKKQEMTVFREFAAPGRFLALRPEEIESEAALMKRYDQRSEADCQSVPICRPRLEFWRQRGPESAAFLGHLKQKNLLGLAVDLGLGRAVVFSQEFDRVETQADFQRLSEKLTF